MDMTESDIPREKPKNQATKVISGNSSKFPLVCYLLTVVIKYVDLDVIQMKWLRLVNQLPNPWGILRKKKPKK